MPDRIIVSAPGPQGPAGTGGGGGVTDGDKGEISVSNSGATWSIDAGVVTTTKLGGDITAAGKALLDDADAAAQRTTLGLGTAATSASSAFAASSHTHAASDIASGTLAIARIPTGTTSSTVCIGNDSRLSDARTPTSHVHSAADITSGSLDAARIDANSLALSKLATIASQRILGNSSVSTGSVSTLTVTSPLVIDTSTGSLKLNNVSTSELSDGSVTTAKVADAGVTEAKLASAAVTTAKLADGAVTMAKIAQASATNGQVIKWNGTAWAPADDATATGGSGAPSDADYLVKTSNGGLSAERVVGDSTSVTANWTTAGQVSFERAALTGDVTASANANATTIAAAAVGTTKLADGAVTTAKLAAEAVTTAKIAALAIERANIADGAINAAKISDDAVTYAKLQNVSAASRLLGRGDSGSGDAQEITIGSGLSMTGTTLAATGGGGSGAPTGAQYVVIATDTDLTAERVLTAGTGITVTDGGAGGNVTLAVSSSLSATHLTNYVNVNRTISAGNGLTGGGDLGANRTLAVSYGGTGSATTVSRSDHTHTQTDSYVGVIESPTNNKTYTIELYAATARTLTAIRTKTDSGTATITLKRENSGDSNFSNVASGISVSSTRTDTTSLSNTSVAAGKRIQIEFTATSTPVHFQFVIEYTDTV